MIDFSTVDVAYNFGAMIPLYVLVTIVIHRLDRVLDPLLKKVDPSLDCCLWYPHIGQAVRSSRPLFAEGDRSVAVGTVGHGRTCAICGGCCPVGRRSRRSIRSTLARTVVRLLLLGLGDLRPSKDLGHEFGKRVTRAVAQEFQGQGAHTVRPASAGERVGQDGAEFWNAACCSKVGYQCL